MSSLLKTYDFPDPMQTAGGRELTITPLQQLFVMNSPFMHEAAVALAANGRSGSGRHGQNARAVSKGLEPRTEPERT